MRKSVFRSDYALGYRMSNGTQNVAFVKPNAENYYALALCVYEDFPSGKALYAMGIAPEAERTYEIVDCPYKNMACAAYTLNKICGVQQKTLASLLKTSAKTLRKAINFFAKEGLDVRLQSKTATPA